MDGFTTLQTSDRPVVVMDNGSGYTKMGFSGNAAVRSCSNFKRAPNSVCNTMQKQQRIYSYLCPTLLSCMQPNFIIPTAISLADSMRKAAGPASCSDDCNILIGEEAVSQHAHSVHYPIRHGVVFLPGPLLLETCIFHSLLIYYSTAWHCRGW